MRSPFDPLQFNGTGIAPRCQVCFRCFTFCQLGLWTPSLVSATIKCSRQFCQSDCESTLKCKDFAESCPCFSVVNFRLRNFICEVCHYEAFMIEIERVCRDLDGPPDANRYNSVANNTAPPQPLQFDGCSSGIFRHIIILMGFLCHRVVDSDCQP